MRTNETSADKVDFERLREWVERQAAESCAAEPAGGGPIALVARRFDLSCSLCGYGVAWRAAPARCPMCGGAARWTASRGRAARRALLHPRLAG